jgi:hypothetical protein
VELFTTVEAGRIRAEHRTEGNCDCPQASDLMRALYCALEQQRAAALRVLEHVVHALTQDAINSGRIIENLNTDPASVIDFSKSSEDRFLIDISHARP